MDGWDSLAHPCPKAREDGLGNIGHRVYCLSRSTDLMGVALRDLFSLTSGGGT